jgi:hypothetical protein
MNEALQLIMEGFVLWSCFPQNHRYYLPLGYGGHLHPLSPGIPGAVTDENI